MLKLCWLMLCCVLLSCVVVCLVLCCPYLDFFFPSLSCLVFSHQPVAVALVPIPLDSAEKRRCALHYFLQRQWQTRQGQKDKTRQGKTRQGKTRQDKARQGKARQDKTKANKDKQDKTRQHKIIQVIRLLFCVLVPFSCVCLFTRQEKSTKDQINARQEK